MEKTIFEKIIEGEIPATKVYEDDKFLAFLDISPVEYGHTLIIPKNKVVWMEDSSNEEIGEIFVKAKDIMKAMKKAFGSDLIKLSVVGDEVPYFHIHLIPIDLSKEKTSRKSYDSPEQMQEYADKIKKEL